MVYNKDRYEKRRIFAHFMDKTPCGKLKAAGQAHLKQNRGNRAMARFVYADNAATTKLDIAAFEAMKPYLLDEYGNASQPYSFARKPKQAIQDARKMIAECIGAMPEEIFFTSGGTESDNWAIKGVVYNSSSKKAAITSEIEHHAVLRACADIEKQGYPVAYLPVNSSLQHSRQFCSALASSTVIPFSLR